MLFLTISKPDYIQGQFPEDKKNWEMVENFRSHTYASQRYKTGGRDGPWRTRLAVIIGRSFENKALIMFEFFFLVISKRRRYMMITQYFGNSYIVDLDAKSQNCQMLNDDLLQIIFRPVQN